MMYQSQFYPFLLFIRRVEQDYRGHLPYTSCPTLGTPLNMRTGDKRHISVADK